jgi:hypothetical protein
LRELIPVPVYESIQNHLRTVASSAPTGWERNRAEEDSLTGDLGRALSTRRSVLVNANGEDWRWSVTYKKFRGRGRDAFEKSSGADGIIQIETAVRDATFFKGVLFQAKKGQGLRNEKLKEQLRAIEGLAPGGSAVISFGPNGYFGIRGTDYLNPDTMLVGSMIRRMSPLASFFDGFLECSSGLRDLYYDAVRERLLLPTLDGHVKAVSLEVRHRIKIDIASS